MFHAVSSYYITLPSDIPLLAYLIMGQHLFPLICASVAKDGYPLSHIAEGDP